MDNPNSIMLDVVMLHKIKAGYIKARQQKAESFKVDTYEFHTGYAGYFLEYHCPRFGVHFDKKSF